MMRSEEARSMDCPSADPSSRPPQKSVHALAFLRFLGRDEFEFRCFTDQGTRKRAFIAQRFVGSFEEHKSKLRRLNDTGYGIFVQVNASNGAGNKAANIVSAPCFFVDLDGAPRENIGRLGLPPHCEIESSPGKYHAYWRVANIPLPNYKAIQQRLAKLIGSDPAVCDLPRVMRLPGFLHQKDTDNPYLVQPLQVVEQADFTFAEFEAALRAAEAKHCPPKPIPAKSNDRSGDGCLGDDLARGEGMLRFLVAQGRLDLGDYQPWIELGISLKNSHGEAGFPLWHRLSQESKNYVDEDDCRTHWDRITLRPNEADRKTVATYWQEAKSLGYDGGKTRTQKPRGTGERKAASDAGRPDQAIRVVEAADEAGDERFLDLDGTPHVRFRQKVGKPDEHWETSRIDGERYQQVLRRRFFLDAVTKTFTSEQLKCALSLLAAEAVESGVRHPVYLRSGWRDRKLYIDLGRGNGQAIEVDGDGFRTIASPPIHFVLGSRGALPLPEAGGSLADLIRHMPTLEHADVQRVLAFAIGTFNPEGTYPMLLFSGGHGTAKSMKSDMVVSITDPPVGRRDARFSFTNKEQDLLIHASSAQVLCFDNVSSFGSRESDMLCRLLSGAAFSTRMLYTNGEEHRIALRRPIVATSIETPTRRGDLLDRMLPIHTHKIAKRKTEEDVWAAFEADRPKVFGLVLTGISQAIRNRQDVARRVTSGELELPRLADFAAFVEGAADVLELAPGEFCGLLRHEQSGLQAEAAAGDPLGAALVRYFSAHNAPSLDVTAAELLERLADGNHDYRPNWPSANKVCGLIRRIEPGLRDLGIEVRFSRPQGKRNVWTMQIAITEGFFPNRSTGAAF